LDGPLGGGNTVRDPLVGDATKVRLFAAGVDNLLAMFLASLIASRVPELTNNDRVAAAIVAYLAYFLVQEGAWSNTIGKRLFGLRICRLSGARCGWRAALIRTGTRVLEVNPLLFGGLPAALAGVFSKRHQRFGDMLSGCLVVRATRNGPQAGAAQREDAPDGARG